MPKDKVYEYRLRLDGERELDDQFKAFLIKRSDAFILVHHVTPRENPHYHAWVRSTVSPGNFTNYVRKEFNVSGNRQYSCPRCDPDRRLEYWAYLFNTKKGNVPTLIHYEGVSPLDIAAARERAKQIAGEFETRMKDSDKKKLTKFDIAEKLSNEKFATRGDLYDAVVKLLHMNRMCSNSFVIKDIMSTTLHINGDKDMKACLLKYFTIEGI